MNTKEIHRLTVFQFYWVKSGEKKALMKSESKAPEILYTRS